MNREAIIAAYEECEARERKANPPAGLLSIDTVRKCMAEAAKAGGVRAIEASAVVLEHKLKAG